MDILRSLVQNLIVIIILAMLLEMLLPAGEMRKYVKMVMGLLILVAVVQSVGELARLDYAGELPSLTQKENESQFPGILEAGKKISGDQQQKAIEQYRVGLANQVKALASLNEAVQVLDVDVNVQSRPADPGFGQVQEITLAVAAPPGPAVPGPGGGVTAGVEPVSVQVGRREEATGPGETKAGPQPGEVTDLVQTVANFYNLKPEQVKVIYR